VKRIGASKLLGIAMGPQSLSVAELAAHGTDIRVARAAEFVYPDGISPDNPAQLGQALAAFLRKEGFGPRTAIVGLSAKWLMTRRHAVPPAPPRIAAASLRLYAEGEFSSELADLVIDFAGQTRNDSTTSVLVIATGKSQIDRCQAVAKAAGLRLRAITATGGAMAWISRLDTGDNGLVLCLGRDEAELVVRQNGMPTQIRHVPMPDGDRADPASLIGELRRTLAGLPDDQRPASVCLCGTSLQTAAVKRAIEERLAMKVDAPPFKDITFANSLDIRFATAIAVALVGLQGVPGTVSFLDSRLAAPPERTNRRPVVWGSIAATVIVLGIGAAWFHLQQQKNQLASMKAWMDDNKTNIEQAEKAANRLAVAQSWFGGKPRFIACMGELTSLFPEEGSIWATTLSLRQDVSGQEDAGKPMVGQVSGRATGQQQALALSDKLRDSKRFADVKPGEVATRSGPNAGESTFSISFVFKVPE
jgi:hypothetical protein